MTRYPINAGINAFADLQRVLASPTATPAEVSAAQETFAYWDRLLPRVPWAELLRARTRPEPPTPTK